MTTLASEKQVAFLRSLVVERIFPSDQVASLCVRLDRNAVTKAEASDLIGALLKAPKKAAKVAKANDIAVPAGHYAVTYDGALRFYKVVDGKGKWEGRRFLNRYSSDNFVTRIPDAEKTAVLAAIESDYKGARQAFAAETVRCWRCGRRLTDEASRIAGIGPDCAGMV